MKITTMLAQRPRPGWVSGGGTCCYCESPEHIGADHPGVRLRTAATEQQRHAQVEIVTHARWLRLAAIYDPEPTAFRIGVWRTNGNVQGWNLRLGRRYSGPRITLLAHTRRTRHAPA